MTLSRKTVISGVSSLAGALLSFYMSRCGLLALWIFLLPFILPKLVPFLSYTPSLFDTIRNLRPLLKIAAGIGISVAVSFILSLALGNSGVILSQFMAGPLIWMLTTSLPEESAA